MQEAVSIAGLLDELEKLGVNVEQLRKLYASRRQLDVLRKSLIRLYQSHLMQHAINKVFLTERPLIGRN
jgi:hypothetical protein